MLLIKKNTHTLNIWVSWGFRASGKIKTDRYNFKKSTSWEQKQIDEFINLIKQITGCEVIGHCLNDNSMIKNINNQVEAYSYKDNIPIPIRFKVKGA